MIEDVGLIMISLSCNSVRYLPFTSTFPSEECYEIDSAREVLDRDHYGLDDIKQRILEFIAVGKLKGTVQGKLFK